MALASAEKARVSPNELALADERSVLSWAQLDDTLNRIANALLDRETIDSEELMAIYEGRPLPHREKLVVPTWADKERNAKDKRRGTSIFGPPKPAS